jgi:hypothetical protein
MLYKLRVFWYDSKNWNPYQTIALYILSKIEMIYSRDRYTSCNQQGSSDNKPILELIMGI